jgi:hypothetical protein
VLISGKFEDEKTALSGLRHHIGTAPRMKAPRVTAV